MKTQNDGGPAYPHTGDYAVYVKQPGMTIRQRYKMAALTGLLACDSFECSFKKAAEKAGEVADAMLAEDKQHAAKQRN